MEIRTRDEVMERLKDLESLLRNMSPEVNPGEYVFAVICEDRLEELSAHALLVFLEKEGITVIIPRELADDQSIEYDSTWGYITLNVHSDLEAIGFLAEIARALKEAAISVNVVSAFYHDHLFVPFSRVQDALEVLRDLTGTRER
jgi:hypothetical protein